MLGGKGRYSPAVPNNARRYGKKRGGLLHAVRPVPDVNCRPFAALCFSLSPHPYRDLLTLICGLYLLVAAKDAGERCPLSSQISESSAFLWRKLVSCAGGRRSCCGRSARSTRSTIQPRRGSRSRPFSRRCSDRDIRFEAKNHAAGKAVGSEDRSRQPCFAEFTPRPLLFEYQ